MSLSVNESKMSRMGESAGTEKKKKKKAAVMSLRRTDTDKDNCRLKRKHCFFQSHAGAVKSHKDILFQ